LTPLLKPARWEKGEDGRPRECFQKISRPAIAVVEGEIKRARAPPGSVRERQRRTRARDKRSARCAYFTRACTTPINFRRSPLTSRGLCPKTKLSMADERVSDTSPFSALMTKNRRDVHGAHRKSLSREEINAFVVCCIDSNLRASMTK